MNILNEGDRVRILVDAPPLFEGGWGVRAGDFGTVTRTYGVASNIPGYGVLLDFDPDQLATYFDAREVEKIS